MASRIVFLGTTQSMSLQADRGISGLTHRARVHLLITETNAEDARVCSIEILTTNGNSLTQIMDAGLLPQIRGRRGRIFPAKDMISIVRQPEFRSG
jgi:hypothetical protein